MLLIVSLIYGLICYLIGEFFGRAKHIGRWWTMFLFWSAPIPIIGLLALIFSPSAKQPPTLKRNFLLISLGVIFLLLSIKPLINIFTRSGIALHFSYIYFTAFVIHGIYFTLLGNCNVKNLNPKYYFKDMQFNFPKLIVEQKTEVDTVILKNDKIESPIQPLAIDESILLQKLFDLGIVSLEEFNAKKILIEEKRIAEDILKQKEIESILAKENFKKKLEENRLAINILKSLLDSGILTKEEYNSKVAIINESEILIFSGNKELQAMFETEMKKGEDALSAKNYQAAIDAFTEALSYKKDDATAKAKLDEAFMYEWQK